MTSSAQRLRLVESGDSDGVAAERSLVVAPSPAVGPTATSTSGSPGPIDVPAAELDGDASRALESVVNRFDAFIRRSARHHGLRGMDVDEVVQELRVRMWKSLGTAELIRRAKPSYIYRAAISASIDIIRRRRARKADAVPIEEAAPIAADPHRTADARLEQQELAVAVHRAVDLLAESRRAVVRMHLAGYERDEIGELLGWSEAKTRNLLYRGLADLRKTLESWGIHGSREHSR
jgi:RNA polymerase sigma-70 factor (ECF subfamily)